MAIDRSLDFLPYVRTINDMLEHGAQLVHDEQIRIDERNRIQAERRASEKRNEEIRIANLPKPKKHRFQKQYKITIKDIVPPDKTKVNKKRHEYKCFVKHIKENGLLQPIWLWHKNGKNYIVDGQHRYQALIDLGIEGFYYFQKPNKIFLSLVEKKYSTF